MVSVSMYGFLIVILSLKESDISVGAGRILFNLVMVREENQILGRLTHVLGIEESRGSVSLGLVSSPRQCWPPASGRLWPGLRCADGTWVAVTRADPFRHSRAHALPCGRILEGL